jgi:hypothetical protein
MAGPAPAGSSGYGTRHALVRGFLRLEKVSRVYVCQERFEALAVPVPTAWPGRKHERSIVLEPWQEEIVAKHPGDLARGLFHSDGYRGINRVRRPLKDGDRWYEYPRYLFVNHSADIHRLCGQALDRLGVAWRFSKPTTISVARRDAVTRLDEFVGPKY